MVHRRGPRQRALFEGEIRVQIDRRLHLLVPEPQGDHGRINAGVQQSHRRGVTPMSLPT
jgi:hypothetical protein